ncbi:hypothetical protein HPG69_006398, partial [Diceros bicornis minor]
MACGLCTVRWCHSPSQGGWKYSWKQEYYEQWLCSNSLYWYRNGVYRRELVTARVLGVCLMSLVLLLGLTRYQ